jgi:hypothetical protein
MSKLLEKPEIDAIADGDGFYFRDLSDPSNPDKWAPFSKVRPAGSRITNNLRYNGTVTIPGLAAGAEGEATVTVTGIVVGDHATFNLEPPANIAVLACWVSAADTLRIRFRNTHASSAFVSAASNCLVLVSRAL